MLLAIVLIRKLASSFFVLPLVLFEGFSPARSFAESERRTGGQRSEIALLVASWVVVFALLSSMLLGLVRGGASVATGLSGDRLGLLVAALTVVLFAWFAASLLVNLLTNCFFALFVADRYFDYDTNYLFKDRDVAVFGPAAREMRESFEWFWTSPRTVPVQHLRDVASVLLNSEPGPLPPYQPPARLRPVLAEIGMRSRMAALFVEPALAVDRLEYFADAPRKHTGAVDDESADISRQIYEVLQSARHSVLIQSPYMVLSRRARKMFRELREASPELELVFSTNSLASTDADTVYANTHRHKHRYVENLGFRMHEFKPYPGDAPDFFPRWRRLIEEKKNGVHSKSVVSGDDSTIPMPSPRVGLHSKSMVVDGRVAMIKPARCPNMPQGFLNWATTRGGTFIMRSSDVARRGPGRRFTGG